MKKLILLFAAFSVLSASQVNAQESSLQDVVKSYIDVKNALVKDDIKGAKAAATTLADVIHQVPVEKLSEVEQRVWMAYQTGLSSEAVKIKGADDLKLQRKYFMSLSSDIYSMISMVRINNDALYYQFCPMANEGKGAYWVSEKQAIANPYFGKMMLTCGSTKETISAKQ